MGWARYGVTHLVLTQERLQRHALERIESGLPVRGSSTQSSAYYKPPKWRRSAAGWGVETSTPRVAQQAPLNSTKARPITRTGLVVSGGNEGIRTLTPSMRTSVGRLTPGRQMPFGAVKCCSDDVC